MSTTSTSAWLDQFRQSFAAGEAHAFIVHGDVNGYAHEAVTHRGLLLTLKREVVAVYTLGRGITFPLPSMRTAALRWLGLATTAPANPLIAAVSGLSGPQDEADPFESARRPAAALDLLERLILAAGSEENLVVILDGADLICPDLTVGKGAMSPDDRTVLAVLRGWATDRRIAATSIPIFLLTRTLTEIHPDLREATSGYKAIEIPLPNRAQRLAYVTWYVTHRASEGQAIPFVGVTADEIANLTAGLSLRHIEDILLLGVRQGGVSRELIKARKDAIIAADFTDVAEMIEPVPDAQFGGQERLRHWAQDEVIAPLREGRTHDAPKGVLLVGPPGSGKTFFVGWLAGAVGFNAVALKAENILGGIVGESEAKLKRFFTFVRNLAPCLVFMDELDQSDMAQRGNGSGNPVASNLFNQMLQFMSDPSLRGQVIMVFASNRPDLIDSALLRFGRMDAIIPVLLPSEPERAAIIAAQARTQGAAMHPEAVTALAAATESYSAADLGGVVSKARTLARRAGDEAITPALALDALSRVRPNSPQTANYYTLLAVNACNDTDLLPPEYAGMLADRTALQQRIAAQAPGTAPVPPLTDGPRRGRSRDL